MQSQLKNEQLTRDQECLTHSEPLLTIDPVAYFTIYPGAVEEMHLKLGVGQRNARRLTRINSTEFRKEASTRNPKGDVLSPLPPARPVGASFRSAFGKSLRQIIRWLEKIGFRAN